MFIDQTAVCGGQRTCCSKTGRLHFDREDGAGSCEPERPGQFRQQIAPNVSDERGASMFRIEDNLST
jgi:hypothetical protein